jgi:hypothetical protein
VALEDLDGVNGVDAVFAVRGWRNNICLNDGMASFACTEISLDGNDSFGVALADIDGNGYFDAVFANHNGPNRACLNDGAGSFSCDNVSSDTNDSRAVAAILGWHFSDGFETGDVSAWSNAEP